MADAALQTTNFKFQKIADGSIGATAGQTAVAGVLTKGSQELEPQDFNATLTTIDNNLPAPVTGITSPAGTIAAAGTNLATATPLAHRIEVVTAADGTKGVALPTATAGAFVSIYNSVAAVLKVYPQAADTINALTAGTAISMAASTSAEFQSGVAGKWFTTPVVPS